MIKKDYDMAFKMPIYVENKYKFYLVYFFHAYEDQYHHGTPMLRVSVAFANNNGETYKYEAFPYIDVINGKYRNFANPILTKDLRNFIIDILRFAQKVVSLNLHKPFDEREYSSGKVDAIYNFDRIPVTYSVSNTVKEKYDLNECMPVLLDVSLPIAVSTLNVYKKELKNYTGKMEIYWELKRHVQLIKMLYERLQPLSKEEIDRFERFQLPYDKLKLRVWTQDYRRQVFGMLTEAYRNITGHYFLPFAVMNGLSDSEIDKKAIRYASLIVDSIKLYKIEAFAKKYYEDKGILKDVVVEINKKQMDRVNKANGKLVAYFKYVDTNLKVLRCIPKENVFSSYRDDHAVVKDLSFVSVNLMLKGRTEEEDMSKKDLIMPQGGIEI